MLPLCTCTSPSIWALAGRRGAAGCLQEPCGLPPATVRARSQPQAGCGSARPRQPSPGLPRLTPDCRSQQCSCLPDGLECNAGWVLYRRMHGACCLCACVRPAAACGTGSAGPGERLSPAGALTAALLHCASPQPVSGWACALTVKRVDNRAPASHSPSPGPAGGLRARAQRALDAQLCSACRTCARAGCAALQHAPFCRSWAVTAARRLVSRPPWISGAALLWGPWPATPAV